MKNNIIKHKVKEKEFKIKIESKSNETSINESNSLYASGNGFPLNNECNNNNKFKEAKKQFDKKFKIVQEIKIEIKNDTIKNLNDQIRLNKELNNLKMINEKLINDTSIKNEIIKKLNNENIMLKNQNIELIDKISKMIKKNTNDNTNSNSSILNKNEKLKIKKRNIDYLSTGDFDFKTNQHTDITLSKSNLNMIKNTLKEKSKSKIIMENKVNESQSKKSKFYTNELNKSSKEEFNNTIGEDIILPTYENFNTEENDNQDNLLINKNIDDTKEKYNNTDKNINPNNGLFSITYNEKIQKMVVEHENIVNKIRFDPGVKKKKENFNFESNKKLNLSNKSENKVNRFSFNATPKSQMNVVSDFKNKNLYLESKTMLPLPSITVKNNIKSSLYNHINTNGMYFYDDFKFNNANFSFLKEINGTTPIIKYKVNNIIPVLRELHYIEEYLNKSLFLDLSINDEADVKEKKYYLNTILNDFKLLLKNAFLSNNLLKVQLKLQNRISPDELYNFIEKTGDIVNPSEKIILFILNKKRKCFITKTLKNEEYIIKFSDISFVSLLLERKCIILDNINDHPNFPKQLKLIDREFNTNTQSVLISPIFSSVIRSKDSSNTNSKLGENYKSSNFINKSHDFLKSNFIGFLYFINKQPIKESEFDPFTQNSKLNSKLLLSNSNEKCSVSITNKSSIKLETEVEAIKKKSIDNYNLNLFSGNSKSYNSDDESICNNFSKLVSICISNSYREDEFLNQDYKLKKSLSMIQMLNSNDNQKNILSLIINGFKKIFFTDHVQIVIPLFNEKELRNKQKIQFSSKNISNNNSFKKLEGEERIVQDDDNKTNIYKNGSNYLIYKEGKEIKTSNLKGIIGNVSEKKNFHFTNDCKNHVLFNPMIDLDGCSNLCTIPFLDEKMNLAGIIQFEYILMKVPWENDCLIHGLSRFDNDIIDTLSHEISIALKKIIE